VGKMVRALAQPDLLEHVGGKGAGAPPLGVDV
jgi:hypothetical protein